MGQQVNKTDCSEGRFFAETFDLPASRVVTASDGMAHHKAALHFMLGGGLGSMVHFPVVASQLPTTTE